MLRNIMPQRLSIVKNSNLLVQFVSYKGKKCCEYGPRWPALIRKILYEVFLLETRNGTAPFKNVNNCWYTNIYSYLETSSGQSSNPYLNFVHFSNTWADYKSVAAKDSCFPALVSNTCCSIIENSPILTSKQKIDEVWQTLKTFFEAKSRKS